MCSLCRGGIIGGGLYISDTEITYKTNKLTVDKAYKNLVLPISEIKDIKWKWIIFPIANFYMNDGSKYTFIIFNKKRFSKHYNKTKSSATE